MPKKPASPDKSWKLIDTLHLTLSILTCQLAGIIGTLFTRSEIPNWYAYLDKPFFTPPGWVFGPVWTILYALMGIALFLGCKYETPRKPATVASYWFYAQLAVNVLWSVVFFGFHSVWGGLLTIVILWLLIYKTMRLYWHVNTTAGWLFVPYLAWVSYATLLNLGIALLN